jgi:hypothetical protein
MRAVSADLEIVSARTGSKCHQAKTLKLMPLGQEMVFPLAVLTGVTTNQRVEAAS